MADEGKDTVAIVLGVGAAALVVGGFLYFAFKSPAAPPSGGSNGGGGSDSQNAPPPSNAPISTTPATTFAWTMTGDANITLKAGQTVLVTLPEPNWGVIVENHDGGAGYLNQVAGQDPHTYVISAISPGVSVVHFGPAVNGPPIVKMSLAITITP
jgi:hypothetical protein